VLLVFGCCIAAATAASTLTLAKGTVSAGTAGQVARGRSAPRLRGGGEGNAMEGEKKGGGGTLYLIGLGLGDEKDITVKGLETVRRCKAVFLEAYTSILGVEKEKVEEFYGREISLMDREAVEQVIFVLNVQYLGHNTSYQQSPSCVGLRIKQNKIAKSFQVSFPELLP